MLASARLQAGSPCTVSSSQARPLQAFGWAGSWRTRERQQPCCGPMPRQMAPPSSASSASRRLPRRATRQVCCCVARADVPPTCALRWASRALRGSRSTATPLYPFYVVLLWPASAQARVPNLCRSGVTDTTRVALTALAVMEPLTQMLGQRRMLEVSKPKCMQSACDATSRRCVCLYLTHFVWGLAFLSMAHVELHILQRHFHCRPTLCWRCPPSWPCCT